MFKSGRKLFLFIALPSLLLLVGCPKTPPPPTPQDTILGPGGERLTYRVVSDAYTGEHEMLEVRPPDPGFMSTENQIRDLLPTVYFDYDLASIFPEERQKLQEAASHMLENSSDRLLIEGHCDWRGTTEYNLALGDRRANSVKDYLESLGVDGSRMEINSKGDFDAIEEGSVEQMANDRRAVLIIVR